MSNYTRVLPRDAFNEAMLLKCIAFLTLHIENNYFTDLAYDFDGEAFNVVQSEDGSISVANLEFMQASTGDRIEFYTAMNARASFPLECIVNDDYVDVFHPNGDYTDEFNAAFGRVQ